ncbi:MAG: PEGA domain-containing protein [bacterium]
MIVTYSMGYRYNFKKNKVEKMGLLSIKTQQDDVHIFINEKLHKHKVRKYSFIPKTMLSEIDYPNDVKISLPPGEYDIKLSKEGFWDWKGKISIGENKTTFIQTVVLFEKNVPLKLDDGDIANIDFRNNADMLFLKYEKATTTLTNFHLEDFNNFKIYESIGKIKYISSANNKRILIEEEFDYLIIDPAASENKILLSNILDEKLVNVKWDIKDDYKLYAIGEKSGILFEIDLISMRAIPIGIPNCQDYIVINRDDIWALEIDSQTRQTVLKKIKGHEKEIIEMFPFAKDIRFIKNNSGYLFIKDNGMDILYIVDTFAKNVSKIKASIHCINKFAVNNYHDKILYANDFEIWMYDLKEDKKNLITRLSSPIKNILWHKNENYLIFSTATNINIIEILNFGNNNYVNLVSATEINEILLDDKARNIYFAGSIGSQHGLYGLELY